jgi:uncharacterized protein (TIGR00290 family)
MKTFLAWSGGKDSAYCLYKATVEGLPPSLLVTSVNEAHDRVSMHGVRSIMIEQQALCLGLPFMTIPLPAAPSMNEYERAISSGNQQLKGKGFGTAMFGDLFLDDLKVYREQLYTKDGIGCSFPLWQMDTGFLLKDFISLGFKAIIVCVNSRYLDTSFCGRIIDQEFLDDLPLGVDPCGENGEYHSFVFDGPGFSRPVVFKLGEVTYQEYAAPKQEKDCFKDPEPPAGFYFQDLVPV